MWLDRLKIAIVEKDAAALDKLMDSPPQLKEEKEIEEAICLLKEANSLMYALKNETSASMKQIKTNLDFLRSMDIHTSKSLDIRS
ncbi:MAG: hypothetical protein PHO62_04980 [Sulfurimonas sp.]|uniref:hypothetical protein n=1 Tax=Sulfurimonas sp. TaxID=2022749 RepID=UPI002624BE94|nr:hypothetical protein [Sulfurimonas sp.]MDD5372760.1 hypothetical protein [Sulfurimonas sp.]